MSYPASLSAMTLDTLLKATVLLLLAWVVAMLLKKQSAAARHLLRACFLASLLLLPLSSLLPPWHVRGLPVLIRPSPTATPSSAAEPSLWQAPVPNSPLIAQPARHHIPGVRNIARERPDVTAHASALSPGAGISSLDPSTAPASTKPRLASGRDPDWAVIFAVLWTLGVLFFGLRTVADFVRIKRLVQRAKPVSDPEWICLSTSVSRTLGVRRRVTLLESSETDVPLAYGVLRPAVILPSDYNEWPEVRRHAILRHEIAHIKRLDSLSQIVANAASALYWFHPLVWLMVRAMRAEGERACDDHVLAAGTKASDYAHELLNIVSSLHRPAFAAALAMARRSQLEGRVLAVLNPSLRRGAVSRKSTFVAATLVLCATLPIAALRPAQQTGGQSPLGAQSAVTNRELGDLRGQLDEVEAQIAPKATVGGQIAAMRAQFTAIEPGGDLGRLREDIAALQAEAAALQAQTNAPQLTPLRAKLALLAEQVAGTRPRPDGAEALEAPDAPQGLTVPDGFEAPEAPEIQAAPAAPTAPAAPAAPAPPSADLSVCGTNTKLRHMNVESNNGYRRWMANWSGHDCSVDLRAEGDIQFNADATAIQSISSGGYFEVNERQGDTLRQIKVTPSGAGLQYVFKINGKEQAFEGDARTWFSSFLLALERATGFAADTRVAKLLAQGGPIAVLDEIDNLQGDYVRGLYFRKLLEQPNLSSAVVLRVINQAGSQIGSDYEMARVLMTVGKQYELADEGARAAFLNAADRLKSDYEHSRVLIELLRRPNISKATVEMALKSASRLNSDYEKSRILLSLVEEKSFEQSNLDFYLKLVSTIHSDYEKSRDLLAPLQRYSLASEQANQIMEAASKMSSDYEKSRLLTSLAGKGKFDESQMGNYLKVVDSMNSDYERSRSLIALMRNNSLSAASVTKAIHAASRGNSDSEKSRVLTTLLSFNLDEIQIKGYLSAVDSMSSSYERSRCLLALLEHTKLGAAVLGKVLETVGRMDGDYEKSRVLQDLAHRYSLQGTLRESYIKAAESISSEYERNRALAAVVRRASL